ncbi:uncharacterized [Tachysurus ichikawai]
MRQGRLSRCFMSQHVFTFSHDKQCIAFMLRFVTCHDEEGPHVKSSHPSIFDSFSLGVTGKKRLRGPAGVEERKQD